MTPEISAWVAVWPTPLTLQDTQQILSDAIAATQAGTAFAATVIGRDCGDVIGWCKLNIDGTEAELGYWIGENHQRKGYALSCLSGRLHLLLKPWTYVPSKPEHRLQIRHR
ncbi:hypothetical protein shim_34310 [Shimia sp. SK013]|nr:hypothetical protein shim_34310 [Shimia sp. SK013]